MSAVDAPADNASAPLLRLRDAARRRVRIDSALHALPWLLVAAAVAWRWGMTWWLLFALAALVLVTAAVAWHRARTIDSAWTARRLDAARGDMDDSTALLLRDPTTLSSMQRLQRERLQSRLAAHPMPDLRPAWRRRSIAASAVFAAVAAAAIALAGSPARQILAQLRDEAVAPAQPDAPPRLTAQRVDITPPPYTRLPQRTQAALSAKVPEGSTIAWTLRFTPSPTTATLVFLDGTRLALVARGDDWTAMRRIDRAALYRIETTPSAATSPATAASLQRIDVIADRAPRLRALQPERNLSLRTNGQRSWSLLFDGDDDYGIDARALLRITRTEGSGENITAKTTTVPLTGTGTATRRRYAHAIDLGAIGLTAGDDLIVQLEVTDNRAPVAQRTRSPSFILRWPPEPDAAASGLEGLLTKTMPAYFRSQRQIIIDAEALQADKRRIDAATFAKRADSIGGDQRILRGRYSQFLGGEDEGAPVLPTNDDPPTSSAPSADAVVDDVATIEMPTNDASVARAPTPPAPHADDHAHDAATATATAPSPDAHDHAHDSGLPAKPAAFGDAGDVLEEFGHVHDQPEATTLLDPATRETLRAALDQMWQAEVHLRQARPDLALPFAYKALGFIKQVQEATRVYLARTAIAPPPIDESRRLGGDRTGLGDARDGLVAGTPGDPAPAAAWRALQDVVMPRSDEGSAAATGDRRAPTTAAVSADAPAIGPALDALDRWSRSDAARVRDPLALAAAIDAVRQSPGCADCRDALRRALWPTLAPPRATIGARPRGDRAGQAYLDALDAEGSR